MARARPTKTAESPEFSEQLAASLCARIATGKKLDRACALAHPGLTADVVYLWLYRNTDFAILYREAKRSAMMQYLEDTVEIADDDSGDTYEAFTKDGDRYDAPNSAAVNRAKLKVETRKWVMSTMAREIFGEQRAGAGSAADGGTVVKIVGGLHDVPDA